MSYVSAYENKIPRAHGVMLAAMVHALIVAGVIAMPGITVPEKFSGPVLALPVLAPPPEPVLADEKPEVEPPRQPAQRLPDRPVIDQAFDPVVPTTDFADYPLGGVAWETGDSISIDPIRIVPEPVLVGARLNKRYAKQFQPAYPVGQLRLEREGDVSVRVLVGTDGRVKQIELVDSPHADFWAATRKQALDKWRFTPATSDGRPIESWMTLTVRFEING